MKEKTKLEQWKERMKNPPPERLAAIEYKSYFSQIMGTMGVCIILMIKGYWYIIFAFIFILGVYYSQGMAAYQKYKMICSLSGVKESELDNEKSPSRRRDKTIREVFGAKGHWTAAVIAALLPAFVLPDMFFILYSLSYLMVIVFTYSIVYYFLIFYIANPFYKMKIAEKEVKSNAKKKEKRRN